MNGQDRKYLNKIFTDLSIPLAKIEEWIRLHDINADKRHKTFDATLENLFKQVNKRVDGLYFAFVIVVIVGIVLGIWVKFVVAG